MLHDARGDATHVLIRHGRGGLDQLPENEIEDYLPSSDTFAPPRRGVQITVEVARAAARLVVCSLKRGGTYDQDKACPDQQDAIVETFTVGSRSPLRGRR